jgi:hypothetical protein
MSAQHLAIDELADVAEGLLDPEGATVAESHIARCPEYRAQSDALAGGQRDESDGSTLVTVVTGCGAGTPSTGPSAVLPR